MNKEITNIELVEGGNVVKQGDYFTVGYRPRNAKGEPVDLTGKTIAVEIISKDGIVYESTGEFDPGVGLIYLSVNKNIGYGDMLIEFTVTDPNDATYRLKFPTNKNAGRLTIHRSTDDLEYVGVKTVTVEQFKADQLAFEKNVDNKVVTLEQRVEEGIGAFTEDTEVLDARLGEPNLRKFNEKTIALLADMRAKHIIVNSNNSPNEESRLQSIINSLAEGDTLELRGTFNVSYLAFLNKKNIRICGNATLNYLVNTLSACMDMFNVEDVTIEGLTFIGLKDKTGAPTTYTNDKNYLIKLGQAKNVHITKCKFKKHLGRSIQVNSVKGTWADQGVSIYKNWFEEMADLNSNEQCCISMEPSAQYSTIENNTFVNVKSAIHNFGANNRINYNNITHCTLNASGAVIDYNDLLNYKQAHILVAQKATADNQSKVQIKGNKINHMVGNVPGIMCIGYLPANENYFVIDGNEILVNDAPHEIIISNASAVRIIGNSLGRNGGTSNVSRMVLHKSELAILDGNYFIGDVVVGIIAGSSFYEGENVRRFGTTTSHYSYVTVASYPNKRYAKETIGFAFIANGAIAGWLSSLIGITTVKNGVGSYTVNHNLGHQNYVVQAITEGGNGIIQVTSRGVSSFGISVVNAEGSPMDVTVIGEVKLIGAGHHNREKCSW